MTIKEIKEHVGTQYIPKDMVEEDRLCGSCFDNLKVKLDWQNSKGSLPKESTEELPQELEQVPEHVVETVSISKKYESSPYDNYKIIYDDKGTPFLDIDADWIKQDAGRIKLDRIEVGFYDYGYRFVVYKKKTIGSEVVAVFFGGQLVGTKFQIDTKNIDIDSTNLDKLTGLLNITSKNNHSFTIQLNHKGQVSHLRSFLDFVNLRENKVLNGAIKQIKLQNDSDVINVEINNYNLQPKEETILSLSYNLSKEEKIIHHRMIEITNFRIINDIWAYPNNFSDYNELKYTHNLMTKVYSFTHDEYDEVVSSNVKIETTSNSVRTGGVNEVSVYGFSVNQDNHSYQGITKGGEKGNIIFMSKGKKFYELEGIDDPRGVVELIRSAKSQFYSKPDESPLEKTVNMDGSAKQDETSYEKELLQVLKMRLIKGEITKEEFVELKEMI
jgi:hypothetical protein